VSNEHARTRHRTNSAEVKVQNKTLKAGCMAHRLSGQPWGESDWASPITRPRFAGRIRLSRRNRFENRFVPVDGGQAFDAVALCPSENAG